MSELMCPRCGNMSNELHPVDPGLAEYLKTSGESNIPSALCNNCATEIRSNMGRGGVLLAREKAKEDNRKKLWKSRVNLIKKARQAMINRAFSDAAVAYEKYIRILEVVFDVKPGELKPELFKDTARTSELTVVASVYWDLLRIYDTSDKYASRQMLAAKQLANFLRFTPIYPDIIRKAESFSKQAKNPTAVKGFLKLAGESKSRCFIASSAFESPFCEEVFVLQKFRDQELAPYWWGRSLIKAYYFVSPSIADLLDDCPELRPPVRRLIHKTMSILHLK